VDRAIGGSWGRRGSLRRFGRWRQGRRMERVTRGVRIGGVTGGGEGDEGMGMGCREMLER
jgi:hypothetical protein